MFALQHIHKSYGDKVVLNDVSFTVNPGEVIALIGENGAGKTTLLKLILEQIKPDSGSVALHHETVGYIAQEADVSSTVTDSFGGQTEPWRVDHVLETVGLGDIPQTVSIASLSGGQKTRLAFAHVLAQDPEPTILLLDEPTNNLDADGLAWLAGFIRSFRGGIVLVSHDRAFINQVASGIAELRNATLRHYGGGNYDFYTEQRTIELQSEQQRYEEYVAEKQRLAKAMTIQQAQSQHVHQHMKRSDNDKYQRDFFRNRVTTKYGQQAKALEGRLKQLGDIERPETARSYAVSLPGSVTSHKLLLQLTDVSKFYDKPVLDQVSLELRGHERMHVQGPNGSGKTTLLKIAAGLLDPDRGKVVIGMGVRIGYFSQDVDGLDYSKSALQNLQASEAPATDLFREAKSLGLTQQDLEKQPGELSRGQQAKLGFAKLLLSSSHFLILDEPTNHLDIPTREQIEAALQAYGGGVLFASHDAYFAQTLKPTNVLNLH
jgi:ATPase subunit of ABC transporter with duplicated ATPase domains